MTDTATEAATPAESAPIETPPEGAESKTFDADYVEKLRKENAKYRTEAKANAEAAAKLKEFEDRDKTEAEKVAERAKTAEDRATQAESRALRLEVAFEKGLTPAQAKRLVGNTREELEADADELLETFKPADEAKPSVDLDLGARGAPLATSSDPRAADLAQIEADLKAAKRR